MAITHRQRWIETLLFGTPDRIPFEPGGGRKSTRERWLKEGLREGASPVAQAYAQAGGMLALPAGGEGFPLDSRMMPRFEEKVIERNEHSQIVQDWKGNVCEIGLEYSPVYLREAIDFVTRRWIKCPVESRADWDDMKTRYDVASPGRLPGDAAALALRLKERDHVAGIDLSGPFWQLREWLGFEALCMMFHDDPEFIKDMISFWESFVADLLETTFTYFIPDYVHISEDMAYKSFPMISPAMSREFLLPTWKRWGQLVRSAGVPLYAMDSDGYIGGLIPLWIEAGINVCDPIEVAAGNDIVKYRKEFGRDMAFRGGIDKREIARAGASISAEIERIMPVVESGGFIPGCDHGVPSDVSWSAFVGYVGLLARATGWL